MTKRRVVVTGLGILCPVGNQVNIAWDAIKQGKSGVGPIDQFDASALNTHFCAAVKNFDPSLAMDNKEVRRTDVFVQYAVEAARQAILDAGLTQIDGELAHRAGVAVGSGIGGLPYICRNQMALHESGPRHISPFFIPGGIINMAAGLISMKHNLMGPNISIVTACTTGTHNIGHAARIIAYGDADVMVAGGSEMSIIELGIGGFNAIKALSKRNDAPEQASRPWDEDRDGFVLGDGAGVLVLEELESAKRRGAKIYAELVGFGMSADAYHMTSPHPEGLGFVHCMTNALNDANVPKESVDYINAHGTSTPVGDVLEALAIKKTFGNHAQQLAVSSTKSMIGHLLGAAGAVEAIFTVLSLVDQVAPPTINLDHPSEGCDLNFVPHVAQQRSINYALSNSFGFGGTNGSLLFRRFE